MNINNQSQVNFNAKFLHNVSIKRLDDKTGEYKKFKAAFIEFEPQNKRDLEVYFPEQRLQFVVKQPLEKLNAADKYDIKVNLNGGGFTGQAEALRLAIARALVEINPEDKAALKKEGFMTRDAREVERKKPGQPKARKRVQFSKR